jgi:hypothetical protein
MVFSMEQEMREQHYSRLTSPIQPDWRRSRKDGEFGDAWQLRVVLTRSSPHRTLLLAANHLAVIRV